ncbi:SH3 domain-containing protein [Aurantimonas sp. Leaf443]|uniref:SH3 domain-containing protein n=1 Tax=Aurantimonas sp. Leaf443 TaxID=1736378 RepID=UPI0006F3DDE3|nr:SH3 domain-containing protein [Aurantimonas sp. Leaf443]KQT83136.1 hypothetical protein ASG48_14290 [Aurantimonas sp. Leaf443]
MLGKLIAAAGFAGTLLAGSSALAAGVAIAVTDVNLRAGPSTAYPPVDLVGAGDRVRVYGCLSNRSWCDVSYDGARGWVSSNYLAYSQGRQRYTGTRFVEVTRTPVIAFTFGNYWDDHYRGRSFYRDRDRYERFDGPRRHDRRDWDDGRRDDDRRDRDRDYDRRDGYRAERGDWNDDRGDDYADRDYRRGWDGPGRRAEPAPVYRQPAPVYQPVPQPLYRVD